MKKVPAVCWLVLAAIEVRAASLPRTILVLPFENQSLRADLGWISESFAETMTTRLSSPERIVLGRDERNAAYAQLAIPPGTPLTLASIYKIAETLGVHWVVNGGFSVEGDILRAWAQVWDVRKMKRPGPLEVSGPLAELVDLQTGLAWRILALRDPGFTVGSEEDFARQFPRLRLDAFENYVRGVLATDVEERVRFLTEANRLDPAERRATLELGRTYYEQKDYENSAQWLRKLGAKDPSYLEALFLLGVDEFFLGREAAAEKAFLELSRQIPLNEVWNNLGFMQARRGRLEDAVASFSRAYHGDPTDAVFCFNLGASLWYVRRYAEAVRYLEGAVRLAPE